MYVLLDVVGGTELDADDVWANGALSDIVEIVRFVYTVDGMSNEVYNRVVRQFMREF